MKIKQLSIFMENKEGRMKEVLQVLKNNEVNIISLSLADTNEFGMLRLLVNKPEEACAALKRNGYSARLTDVLAVKISHRIGTLEELLEAVCEAHINIEYMYALSTGKDDAAIVFKSSDLDTVENALASRGVEMVSPEDIKNIQS